MRAARAGAVAAMRRKSSKSQKGKDEPTTPRSPLPSGRVELDSAAAVSDELQAVLLEDGSLPIGMPHSAGLRPASDSVHTLLHSI